MRAIDDQIDRAALRVTLTCNLVPAFSLGAEWNPRARKASPLANWRALRETDRRPAVVLGTSSDRIGTPRGQAYYATASKSFGAGGVAAPYAGVSYGEYERKARPIGGIDLGLAPAWSLLFLHDGVNVHASLNWARGRHVLGLLFVDFEDPGFSWSVRF